MELDMTAQSKRAMLLYFSPVLLIFGLAAVASRLVGDTPLQQFIITLLATLSGASFVTLWLLRPGSSRLRQWLQPAEQDTLVSNISMVLMIVCLIIGVKIIEIAELGGSEWGWPKIALVLALGLPTSMLIEFLFRESITPILKRRQDEDRERESEKTRTVLA
jgi:hypothetical protein